MEKGHYVFVYGTLRKNECNHKLLKDAVCMERNCQTEGILFDPHLGYPFLVQSKDSRVYGELYFVDEEQLAALDCLEGYFGVEKNNLYDRVEQTVYTDNGNFQALVYVLPNKNDTKNMQQIENGDWCQYQLMSKNSKKTLTD